MHVFAAVLVNDSGACSVFAEVWRARILSNFNTDFECAARIVVILVFHPIDAGKVVARFRAVGTGAAAEALVDLPLVVNAEGHGPEGRAV